MPSKPRVWGTLCDGEFEVISLEKDDLQEALNDVLEGFFQNESVCIGTEINLPKNRLARDELRTLCEMVYEDHVSLVVRHVPTKRLAGVAFNKIQRLTNEEPFFVTFRNNCKSPNAINLMDYMIDMDKNVDVFELYDISCVLELMFLAVVPDFRGKGLGNVLTKYTIELTKELKQKKDGPQAVVALFTSSISQKVGKANNFKVLNSVPYSEFAFNGKTYAERIGPMHPHGEQVVRELY